MSKKLNNFELVIQQYIKDEVAECKMFAKKVANPKKNIQDCCTYVMNTVKKTGREGFDDDEIFGYAMHYYDEEDIKVGNKVGCKVVTNHKIELSPADIEKAKQTAMREVTATEKKKMKDTVKKEISDEEKSKIRVDARDKYLKEEGDLARKQARTEIFAEEREKMTKKKKKPTRVATDNKEVDPKIKAIQNEPLSLF